MSFSYVTLHIWPSGGLMRTKGENIDKTAFTSSSVKKKDSIFPKIFFENEFLNDMEIYEKKTNWRVRGTLSFHVLLVHISSRVLLCTENMTLPLPFHYINFWCLIFFYFWCLDFVYQCNITGIPQCHTHYMYSQLTLLRTPSGPRASVNSESP